MATINEMATLIAEQLERELDYTFTEMLKVRIKYWRSRLLRDSINKKPADRMYFVQSLTLPMELKNTIDCGIPLDCPSMTTKDPVPVPLRANGILFDYVGSVDGRHPFTYATQYSLPYRKHDKYASVSGMEDYVYTNQHIVLPGNTVTPWIRVDGIFEDPEKVAALNCGGAAGEDCVFDESEYPVNGDTAQLIVQYILQVDFNRLLPDMKNPEVIAQPENK